MFLKKLHYKDYNPVLITGIPVEFYDIQKLFTGIADFHCQPQKKIKYKFVLSFVKTLKDVEWLSTEILPYLDDNATFWVSYPKKTSKKFKSEITRNFGWDSLKINGYEGVSMIAIDNDWSAFRFKHISKITRLKVKG